jgi:hypothetical protein
MDALPRKILVAFAKYHSIVIVMRLYEYLASKWVDEETLDKLTIDTFAASKRTAELKEGPDLARDMFKTCWNANIISFLADYSVHQVILLAGYYAYVREQQKQRKQKHIQNSEDEQIVRGGSLALTLLKKSTLLAVTRGVGLAFSSLGGAVGSMLWPGWGTLIGSNMGDGLAVEMTDDMVGTWP